MHWNIEQVIWALVLAAHLVLLIVLMGRDRISRFPWFSASVALSTVHLIADHLLHGKLTSVAFFWQSYVGVLLDNIVGLLVLIELTRRVFSNCKAGVILNAKGWVGWTFVTVGLAAAAVWYWGPWPAWQAMTSDPKQFPLLLVVLSAFKSQLFLVILTVEVGLLMRIFGRRFGSRFTSHTQQIMLGLSTYALGFLAVQSTTDIMKHTVHPTTREEYQHILKLFANMDNARFALWFLVLVWWIVWLWREEPGAAFRLTTDEAPVEAVPADLEAVLPAEIREDPREGDPEFRD
jgi:hypothetical protein